MPCNAAIGDVNAEKQVQVNFIKLLGIAILCIASVAVLLAFVLPIAALFLGRVSELMFHLLRKSGLSLFFHILGSPSSLAWEWSLFSDGQHRGWRGACDQMRDSSPSPSMWISSLRLSGLLGVGVDRASRLFVRRRDALPFVSYFAESI